jgi:ribosomal-protein-alanine N-acetyltransferase
MTPILHVSIASERDARDIARMSRDLIEHGLPWTWRQERVSRAIAAANTNVAVIRERQSLTAFGIMEYWDEDAHLVLFAVRPDRQRQGVGTAVLRWLEASALVAGSQRIRLEARRDNVAARSFYNEHGYHELTINSRMYSGALDGIKLEKWLHSQPPDDAVPPSAPPHLER